ncbi:hypothetical protein [Clostridium sp.]|uniref:hypothetical protein n=1 Tax=Clostridium sp. TaxID=1506 RepID=UPI003A5C032D
MEKNKRDLMILIAIIFIGVNYIIYTYFIKSQLDYVNETKQNYALKQKKLNDLENEKKSIDIKKKEIEDLKKQVVSYDVMVPKIVDTPQLIYDFYNQCSLYNITDSRINFELLDSTEVGNSNFHRLEVDLKIEANKQDVEKFIENLNSITSRRLNVKEIKMYLPSYEDTTKGENGSSEVDDSESTDLFEDSDLEDSYFEDSDLLGAEITFNEYIKGDYKTVYPKNYVFYDSEKEGFGSISDMFK